MSSRSKGKKAPAAAASSAKKHPTGTIATGTGSYSKVPPLKNPITGAIVATTGTELETQGNLQLTS
jgi:hypothetical protein